MFTKQFEQRGNIKFSFDDNLIKEASRCLMCDSICNKCVEVCPNRSNVAIKVQNGFKDFYQIVHIDKICNECGNCETFCPYEGLPYKDKFTIFSDLNEFNLSKSSGILVEGDSIYLRTDRNSKISKMKIDELKTSIQRKDFNDKNEEKIFHLAFNLIENYKYLFDCSTQPVFNLKI
jgi:putative selenate reductase